MSEEIIFNTRREAALYANAHGMIVEKIADGRYKCVVPPEVTVDTTAFDDACAMFRDVCADIGQLIGAEKFRGGFDDMAAFQKSAAFNTLEGLHLGMEWSAANEQCKYEGAKIGLGQPAWWYQCWKTSNGEDQECLETKS